MQSLFSIIHPDNLVKKVMHVSLSFFENDKLKHNSRKPLQQQKLKKLKKKKKTYLGIHKLLLCVET